MGSLEDEIRRVREQQEAMRAQSDAQREVERLQAEQDRLEYQAASRVHSNAGITDILQGFGLVHRAATVNPYSSRLRFPEGKSVGGILVPRNSSVSGVSWDEKVIRHTRCEHTSYKHIGVYAMPSGKVLFQGRQVGIIDTSVGEGPREAMRAFEAAYEDPELVEYDKNITPPDPNRDPMGGLGL